MYKLNKNNEYKKYVILNETNEKIIQLLNSNNIKELNLISLGNSIANGYSINDEIIPLFNRNKDMNDIFLKNNITLNLYNFSRSQNNNDEIIYNWIINNINNLEINKKNRLDYIDENHKMPINFSKVEDLEKYYPKNSKIDEGLKDIIKKDNTIICYSGVTGSFLDNMTRNGIHKNLYGFSRDLISLEASLKYIYQINPNTQIYISGLPNMIGIDFFKYINNKIKKICKLYPNTTFVNGVPCRFLYKNDNSFIFDVHYSKIEYLIFINNILNSILDNYNFNKNRIKFDMCLKRINEKNEINNNNNNDFEEIYKMINYLDNKQLKILLKYYKEKYPHDYFYTPKKEIEKILKIY